MRFKYPKDYCCIVTDSHNWFCKNCKKAHGFLYVNNINENKYCPSCVPAEIKKKSIHINHINEIIENCKKEDL